MTETATLPADVEIIEPDQLPAVFQVEGGADKVIEKVRNLVADFKPDVSTPRGRKEIASLAYKVARSKTAIDAAGKELNAARRAEIEKVDAARRKIRDELDAIRDQVRKPLEEWEAEETARKEAIRARLSELEIGSGVTEASSPEQITTEIGRLDAIDVGPEWEEHEVDAFRIKAKSIRTLRDEWLPVAFAREEEAERRKAEEASRRKAEELAAKRAAQEREEQNRLRRVAGMEAHIEGCRKGQIGGETQPYGVLKFELMRNIEITEAEFGADTERLEAMRNHALEEIVEAMMAEEAELKRTAAKREAEALEKARKEAAERVRREAEEAAQAERDRIAAQEKAEADARARREADKAHRKRITSAIAKALAAYDSPAEAAEAIVGGQIPHVVAEL